MRASPVTPAAASFALRLHKPYPLLRTLQRHSVLYLVPAPLLPIDLLTLGQTIGALTVSVGTAVYLILARHLGFVGARWRLRAARRQWLMQALRTNRWATMSAIELELGFADTFGFGLRADVIRHVFARQNAAEHIGHLRRCRLMVRLNADGTGFERTDRAVKNFRASAAKAMVASIVPLLGCLFASYIVDDKHRTTVMASLVVAYVWGVFAGWLALGFDAAHTVTARASEFPPDHPGFGSHYPGGLGAGEAITADGGASTSGQRSVQKAMRPPTTKTAPNNAGPKRRSRKAGTVSP